MRFGRRDIFEDVAATLLTAAAVLGFTATHQGWNVWLIGDSRRWTAGLLVLLGAATFALVARHIGTTPFAVLGTVAAVLAGLAFWTASLTPLSLLAAAIILVWAVALLRDISGVCSGPVPTH